MNNTTRARRAPRWVASFAAAATLVAASILAAAPAQAAIGDANDPNYLGPLTIAPIRGAADSTNPFTNLSTTLAFPDTHRVTSRTLFYVEGYTPKAIAAAKTTGLDVPQQRTGEAASVTGLEGSAWNSVSVGSTVKILLTGESKATANNAAVTDSRYFSATLTKTGANTWEVAGQNPGTVKTATTTTLANSSTTSTSTTLTATVAPAGITGSVQFKQSGANLGAPVPVKADGTAVYPVSSLTPKTDYIFTAAFVETDTHKPSTSAEVKVTTLAEPVIEPVESKVVNLGVDVPTAASVAEKGLTITTAANPAVTLNGGARTANQAWTATGTLSGITVNDDRPSKAGTAWSLKGSVSKFTSGPNEIAASALGWVPADTTGTAGHGTKGAAASDLSSEKVLASGKTLATRDSTTTVGAALTLTVPAVAVAGNYTARLTLTLI